MMSVLDLQDMEYDELAFEDGLLGSSVSWKCPGGSTISIAC